MTGKTEQQSTEKHIRYTKRDAETQTALGIFVAVISIPVLIGTFWAETTRAMTVNAAAGLVLLGIGVAVIVWGRKTAKKIS